ncbi:MAG: hypothetical protein KTR17_03785 [Cellvibrionaceae bacterium]|nr:hypothetical protein [Cellvibrionaceae bacterium]
MSLLLNALKKAALDKQKREQHIVGPIQDGPVNSGLTAEMDEQNNQNLAETEHSHISSGSSGESYMEYDPKFVQLAAQQPDSEGSAPQVTSDLFIENDESSWDDSLAQNELQIEAIDSDIDFNADEFEERVSSSTAADDSGIAHPYEESPKPAQNQNDDSTSAAHLSENGADELQNPASTKHLLGREEEQAPPLAIEQHPQASSTDTQSSRSDTKPLSAGSEAPTNAPNNTPKSAPIQAREHIQDSDCEPEALNRTAKLPGAEQERTETEHKRAIKQMLLHTEAAVKNGKRNRALALLALGILVSCVSGVYYYLIQTFDAHSRLSSPPYLDNAATETLTTGPAVQEGGIGAVQEVQGDDEQRLLQAIAAEWATIEALPPSSTAAQKPSAGKSADPSALSPASGQPRQAPKKVTSAPAHLPTKQATKPATKPAPTTARKQTILVSQTGAKPADFSQTIAEGFEAWQSGNWQTAEQAYSKALAMDANHRDAILGAAAVATQLGQQQRALGLYQRRIARAPRDEFALAGIIGLGALNTADIALESELNSLLQTFPKAAHLHYLRGTLHARRNRWQAAQSSFFQAWRLDASRPDYVFNLAVAMDHLNLHAQALGFYQDAEKLAANNAANFSINELQARIAQLQLQLAQAGG